MYEGTGIYATHFSNNRNIDGVLIVFGQSQNLDIVRNLLFYDVTNDACPTFHVSRHFST